MSADAVARPRVVMRMVRADGGPEIALALARDQATLGSAGDLVLAGDPFVARHQARLFFRGTQLMVEDLGGGNGVFHRLRAEQELGPGAQVRVGRQLLLVEAFAPVQGAQPLWGSPDPGYRIRLVQMLEGGRRGDAFPLREGENLLGRTAGDICFPGDGFVSSRHAVFTARGGRVAVKDLGSSNGTFCRVGAPMPLASGDQLLVGRQLVKLEIAA